jgi:alkaline phosphatase
MSWFLCLGGAEDFLNSSRGGLSFRDKDYYSLFQQQGYSIAYDNTQLQALNNNTKALGVFSVSNMAKWLDHNAYTANLENKMTDPTSSKGDALNQPGLLEMTNKAIDIVQKRSNGNGWFVMSEAASIDKQMHALDYERVLGELLELDDTVRGSIAKLKDLGVFNDTLIIVTSDHG